MNQQLVLASASPRRQALLEQIGLRALVAPAGIDESSRAGELPDDYVVRMALEKSRYISSKAEHQGSLVLGADTIVCQNGNLLGKPQSEEHAFEIWRMLSGCHHQVITAVAVTTQDFSAYRLSCSDVEFADIPEAAMKVYWQSGEPQDKAGAYAIQGMAGQWVVSIKGSYSGIVGLPLYETVSLLKEAGYKTVL